ncbi:MAG: aldose 1-epimerase family protein [Hyphomicrobiales bacterium]|nr:MAG: aldose 1-epimerase family protein [Hyphomicrobiales bacterium]
MHQLTNDQFSVEIAERGAEIRSIRDRRGDEWLWHGDPAWWSGRSPLLFPVVGRSPENLVSIGGHDYPMLSHGFARTSEFAVASASPEAVSLTLTDCDATRAAFPFTFALTLDYGLAGSTLTATATVANRDSKAMPFQFGFHPGFAWPLPGSAGRSHRIELGNGGEPPLRRLDDDKALRADSLPSPFSAGTLVVEPAMFADDAMIFPAGIGDRIAFVAEGGARLDMVTANLPNFALWQKPGAPFLCLEPWRGTAPLAGAGNALETRHGSLTLAPGDSARFEMMMTFTPVG